MEGKNRASKRSSSSSSCLPTPTPLPPASSSPVASKAQAVDDHRRRGENTVKDEEVERFFALLGNIKAIKESLKSDGTCSKRLKKDSEPPLWQPKFQLEDFRDDLEAESSWIDGVVVNSEKKQMK